MSKRKNTSSRPSPQPIPQYEWPNPGADLPRLPWADWLRLYALEVARSIPGAPSLFPKFLRSGLISFFGVAPMLDPHSLDCDTWAYDHFGGPS
jgi:hypothetical protein